MKPSESVARNRDALRAIVLDHRARNPRLFGSVVSGEDTERSDVDLLVDPTPETTLMDIAAIRHEAKRLLGVTVDVLTPDALPDSFRSRVMDEAVPL
ncbi:MAG: nucleotidyltransferase domain-containing protein [Betaproteobacteria bacterium]|nr:nucleotidyltransferase domain-containing protein [Betaproteobacteria bacterium]